MKCPWQPPAVPCGLQRWAAGSQLLLPLPLELFMIPACVLERQLHRKDPGLCVFFFLINLYLDNSQHCDLMYLSPVRVLHPLRLQDNLNLERLKETHGIATLKEPVVNSKQFSGCCTHNGLIDGSHTTVI